MSTNFTLMKRLMSPSSTLIFPFIMKDCTDPYRSKLSVTDGADDVVVVIMIIQDRVRRTPATPATALSPRSVGTRRKLFRSWLILELRLIIGKESRTGIYILFLK